MDERILSVLNKEYPFHEELHSFKPVEVSTMNQNFFLIGETSKYFLKKYRLDVLGSVERIAEIHAVENYFSEQGIAVVKPVHTNDNSPFIKIGEDYYVIYPFIDKETISSADKLTDKHVMSLARNLAQLHKQGKNVQNLTNRSYKQWSKDKFFSTYDEIRAKIPEENRNNFEELAFNQLQLKYDFVKEFSSNGVFLVNDHLIHGDYHERNVFFENGEVAIIFDFEKTAVYPRSIELVRSMDIICMQNEFSENKDLSRAKLYLSAYNVEYSITDEEFSQGFQEQIASRIASLWGLSEYFLQNHPFGREIVISESKKLEWYTTSINEICDELKSVL